MVRMGVVVVIGSSRTGGGVYGPSLRHHHHPRLSFQAQREIRSPVGSFHTVSETARVRPEGQDRPQARFSRGSADTTRAKDGFRAPLEMTAGAAGGRSVHAAAGASSPPSKW